MHYYEWIQGNSTFCSYADILDMDMDMDMDMDIMDIREFKFFELPEPHLPTWTFGRRVSWYWG